jgi:hypothetical protein
MIYATRTVKGESIAINTEHISSVRKLDTGKANWVPGDKYAFTEVCMTNGTIFSIDDNYMDFLITITNSLQDVDGR